MTTLAAVLPLHRTIMAVDIEGSTTRTNPVRARNRQLMYELVEQALHLGGIAAEHRDEFHDLGDGVLVVIHPVPQAPKTVLLNTVIPTLRELLAEHAARHPEQSLRLRAAVHTGDVHYDARGCYGEDVDITFRLLNSQKLKTLLRQSSDPLVLVVSQDVHRSVIRHGYEGIDDSAFEPLVSVRIAGQRQRGWVHVPSQRLPN
ncbi:hypothetical protein GCM10010174_18170 [Kutzneria viridogrisea]|uniref:Guanylate cyclase domain-containing protein n=2 Tax=Kutzneria TaxID=43356 RepID=W5WFJ4_9PSEU|nr:hypothetical protein [Kutzneria albida]AHH99607.1 hypothetical protein KALB_6247 [Kutzneria albida DSM 43870]MBA8922837.1 class 3 adenylate cyclase [Kutzneria viridogrisea]